MSRQAEEALRYLMEHPAYVRELSKRMKMSTTTTVKTLKALEESGLVEPFKEAVGVGKPRKYYMVTQLGCRVVRLNREVAYRKLLSTLKRLGITATAGVGCSLSFYGAPLVLDKFDVCVNAADLSKAAQIAGGGVRVDTAPAKDFQNRAVVFDGVPYLGLEDLALGILVKAEARYIASLPLLLSKQQANWHLLLELAGRLDVLDRCLYVLKNVEKVTGKRVVPENLLTKAPSTVSGMPTPAEMRELFQMGAS